MELFFLLYLYNYSFFILLSIFESLDTVNNKVTHDCNYDNLHYIEQEPYYKYPVRIKISKKYHKEFTVTHNGSRNKKYTC